MNIFRKRYFIFATLLLVACAIAFCFICFIGPAFAFNIGLDRIIKEKERIILYHIDHKALALVTREFAWPSNSKTLTERFPQPYFEKGDSRIPPSLWIADPARISGNDERVDFEYGGALLHFGISVFKPGIAGEGTLKLQDGVWFYSENGRYPTK